MGQLKNSNGAVNQQAGIRVCPKCVLYARRKKKTECSRCGRKDSFASEMKELPKSLSEIPKGDLIRLIEYRRLNGYDYTYLEKLYPSAPEGELKWIGKTKSKNAGWDRYNNRMNAGGTSKYIKIYPGGGCSP